MPRFAEHEAQRHREAGSVRRPDQLLRIRPLTLVEARGERVLPFEDSVTHDDGATAAFQIALPLGAAVPRSHPQPPSLQFQAWLPAGQAVQPSFSGGSHELGAPGMSGSKSRALISPVPPRAI